jgi:pyruvate dehydrogenase E1 component
MNERTKDALQDEIREWLDSLEFVLKHRTKKEAIEILERLQGRAQEGGVTIPSCMNTPYLNTIPLEQQPRFPGNIEIERRLENIVRWNAMDMVVRANKNYEGIGGHLSTYASAATLFEVGFNHFFRAPHGDFPGDFVYFQGHASPGIYSRAFLEGRLTEDDLMNFRREAFGKGLSSYPHPRLMRDFWQFSTVSMGLSPLLSIYHARFNRYLEDRGLQPKNDARVWAFIGDGECDEPESLGAITVASREELDNLIFVVNCNLQRLDGPVRGNVKIIQDLEAIFRGAGWNVIKVIWGSDWDPLLAEDHGGLLARRMQETVDGEYQKYSVEGGDYFRKHFFGVDDRLLAMVDHLSDDRLHALKRGGHDIVKVYAAYRAAVEHRGSPSVILAKTIKGYGLGEAGEGKNITHQEKKLSENEMKEFRTRFSIPISDDEIATAKFYKPPEDSPEMKYLRERRARLGGYLPQRRTKFEPLDPPEESIFEEFFKGSGERKVTTTMAYVRMLSALMSDPRIGKLIVPIVPDESRTLGIDSLFRKFGIYSHMGQRYEPVDIKNIMYYRESSDGQILEEGITEAGSLASFVAAGTAYSTLGINTIPFYSFYSMFGFQRVGDLIWASADMCARGFLVGGISGRTTLPGEGLQHQDGHSHLLFTAVPSCVAYEPAYAYDLALILLDGIRRMYGQGENVFYYVNVTNEQYLMPPMPEGVREGVLRGIYKIRPAGERRGAHVNLFGSGALLNEVIEAQKILAEHYDVSSEVWNVTSYSELRREALDVERWNMLHPEREPRIPYLARHLEGTGGVFVAVTDFMKSLPDLVAKWIPGRLISLGTDGFGRSDTREQLRRFFEVDSNQIAFAALGALLREGAIERKMIERAEKELAIDQEKPNPMRS